MNWCSLNNGDEEENLKKHKCICKNVAVQRDDIDFLFLQVAMGGCTWLIKREKVSRWWREDMIWCIYIQFWIDTLVIRSKLDWRQWRLSIICSVKVECRGWVFRLMRLLFDKQAFKSSFQNKTKIQKRRVMMLCFDILYLICLRWDQFVKHEGVTWLCQVAKAWKWQHCDSVTVRSFKLN